MNIDGGRLVGVQQAEVVAAQGVHREHGGKDLSANGALRDDFVPKIPGSRFRRKTY